MRIVSIIAFSSSPPEKQIKKLCKDNVTSMQRYSKLQIFQHISKQMESNHSLITLFVDNNTSIFDCLPHQLLGKSHSYKMCYHLRSRRSCLGRLNRLTVYKKNMTKEWKHHIPSMKITSSLNQYNSKVKIQTQRWSINHKKGFPQLYIMMQN